MKQPTCLLAKDQGPLFLLSKGQRSKGLFASLRRVKEVCIIYDQSHASTLSCYVVRHFVFLVEGKVTIFLNWFSLSFWILAVNLVVSANFLNDYEDEPGYFDGTLPAFICHACNWGPRKFVPCLNWGPQCKVPCLNYGTQCKVPCLNWGVHCKVLCLNWGPQCKVPCLNWGPQCLFSFSIGAEEMQYAGSWVWTIGAPSFGSTQPQI